MKKNLPCIDQRWTLFLDRDGVINEEKQDDYIHTWQEFQFYAGVHEAMAVFAKLFGPIVIVTNQRGIAKGVTKVEDLEEIHRNMVAEVSLKGGRIDRVYYCGDMEGPDRKPNEGMGLRAIEEIPAIDLQRSIMIGNTLSDMRFGRRLGVAVNIFLPTTRKEVPLDHEDIDWVFDHLLDAARAFRPC